MTTITSEERSAFFGSFARDVGGHEHLLGLTAAETLTYSPLSSQKPTWRNRLRWHRGAHSSVRQASSCM